MNGLQIIIKNVLEEMATNCAGQGGALGSSSGTPSQFSGDGVWNPKETRLAQPLGGVIRRNFPPLMNSKRKRKKKSKKK